MNKEKVVGLSDRLNEIVDEANRHPNGTPGHITWNKAVYAIEALSKETNSKIIMPKVFDDWRKNFTVSQESSYLAIESLNQEITAHKLGYATLLGNWVNNDFDNRYCKCIDAIINGYEVED